MTKGLDRNKIRIIVICVIVAVVLAGVAVVTTIGLKASYASQFPDYVEKADAALGTADNPYTIVEVVPDVESATVGYLVNGCEPYNLLSIGATDVNDPESAAGLYKDAFASETSPESTIGDPTDAYIFKQEQGSIGTVPASGFIEKKDEYKGEGDPGTDKAYSEFGYYTKVTSGTGNYNYDTSKKCFVPTFGGDFAWTSCGDFKYVGFGQGSCTRVMYYVDNNEYKAREYSYNYTTSSGTVGSKAYIYSYSAVGDFTFVPNNNYRNENIFGENVSEQDITSASIGKKLYMTRTEDVYYQYTASEIICNDLLLKELVGEGTKGNDYVTQVVTVTPRQLDVEDSTYGAAAEKLIDTADMIIIHNSATGYKIAEALQGNVVSDEDVPQFESDGASGDLSRKTINRIVYRGASKSPAAIVFDEEAIQIASEGGCDNMELLYDVYNNLGAKLAYNWMPGKQYDAKIDAAMNLPNYRYFDFNEEDALGKSHFVYNFEGTGDFWFTTAFANENAIAKSNLNEPAFNNVFAGESMSVAKMLSAINKESNGYNQPRKLNILEIQPNEKYYYDVNDKDTWVWLYVNLFPWFIGTDYDIASDVTIATMPTYEFIGRNEDPNETYDLILIGNKEQDETNGGNGYNDAGLQTPIPTEAGGDGVTPSPVSYTAVGDLITTYGGDEIADQAIEDYDNPSNTKTTWYGSVYRWNTDKVEPQPDSSNSDYSYKWKYGLFTGNRWYNTRNVYALKGNTYDIGFARDFVTNIVGDGDADDYRGLAWWYWRTGNLVFGTKHGSDANMIGLRYSGNDLTKKKYDQLLDFSTQAPLIVADDLYWAEINPGWSQYANAFKLDQSSFVYKLANMNIKENSTVHKYANGIDENMNANTVKSEMITDNLSATFTSTLNGASGLPTEYDENATVNYNQQTDSSGNNVLQYHFVLNGNDKSAYGIDLYTDSNGNGIFEGCINHLKEREANGDTKPYESERSSNLIIFDETSKVNVTDGVLYNGHTYLVTRILPPSDIGLVPWKLELYKQGNDSVRFSEEGYTRIRPATSSDRTKIKVLQMNPTPNMSGKGSDSVTVSFANHYWYTLDSDWWGNPILNAKLVNNPEMSNLLNVEDFDIQVDFMDNDYWLQVYGSDRDKWASALMDYDMLIIGFKDMAKFTNNENYIYGFEKFREAGKSVILSHDLCEDTTMGIVEMTDNYNADKIIQSDVRYYLRDISGQLRKYFDAESGSNDYSYLDYHSRGRALTFEPSDNFKIFTSIREYKNTGLGSNNVDYLMQDGGNKPKTPIYDKYTYTYGIFDDWNYTYDSNQGIWISSPNSVIRDYYSTKDNKPAGILQDNSARSMLYYSTINYDKDSNPQYLDKLDRAVNLDRSALVWQTKTFATNKVQAVNEGQITKYPYAIPDTLNVAQTHMQNYQLDLEYDDDGDVLIWYNLTGNGVYKGRNQDCRNNYYIYTKGDITYTGVGHNGSLTDIEKKLFVNTMVAAYRSSASDPYITVLNQDAVNNGKNTVIYLEDRDSAGSNIDILYRINDDTSNAKVDRNYTIRVYKNDSDQPMETKTDAKRATDYTIPVSYSEVKANNEVRYRIELESTYTNDQGVEVKTNDYRIVSVNLMPMFDLR